jgi:RNA polymerase sporulation-specific sigma factor
MNMTGYIHSGNAFPKPLTYEEEKMYVERMQSGDMEARNILIERNLRLVAHMAKKYVSPNVSNDDLISIGTIGLIKAVSTFDSTKGSKLGTYAVKCIQNEILMYMRTGKKHQNIDQTCPLSLWIFHRRVPFRKLKMRKAAPVQVSESKVKE